MAEKMEPREAAAKMAQRIREAGRGTVTPERARQIAENAARRADHRERDRKG